MQSKRNRRPRWALLSIVIVSVLVVGWNIAMFTGQQRQQSRQEESGLKPPPVLVGLVDAQGDPIDLTDANAWKQSPVTWFTILNGPRYFWCDLLASAWHNGITMNIYGWGNTEFNGWLETWRKIPLAIEFSQGLDEDTFMGFVDGADSLFQKPSSEIVEAYNNAKPRDHLFLMSTEINCAVQSLPGHACNNTKFPLTPWGRRYLNSGLYMGPSGALRDFLGFVMKYYLPRYREGTVQRNDQSVIGKAYHDGWRNNFTLDAYTKVFQSVRMAEGHYCQEGGDGSKLPVPDPKTGLLKNCLTNNTPSVFHFNGKAKPFLGKWIKKFWFFGKPIPANAGIFVNKKPKSLRALCPKLKYS